MIPLGFVQEMDFRTALRKSKSAHHLYAQWDGLIVEIETRGVQSWEGGRIVLRKAQKEETGGYFLSVEREIFASKRWFLDELDLVASARSSGDFKDMLGLAWVVLGDGVAREPFDARGASQSGCRGLDELGEPCFGVRSGGV